MSTAQRPLPKPGSAELRELVGNEENRLIYAFLYERRNDPPTMAEVREHIAQRLGQANEQTDRRLRELRTVFEIPAKPAGRNRYVYLLSGWATRRRTARGHISAKTEAIVYERYGYRCAMCGKSPKDDGVRLIIDHKIPKDWGGTDDLENLQPLCEEHNHGKQAHFASFDEHRDAIRKAVRYDEVHLRIGELLKALQGSDVPVEIINVVAREENRGDPTRRLRDLRALGWRISASRRKEGKRTRSYYRLESWKDWPQEGPGAAVAALEADRKRRKERG